MKMERSTKGEKTVGKNVGPLFPRLHVDDTKKIGPKAPPRNKMALYQQLSIPSQRFGNTPTSSLPPPPMYGRMLTNISSSSHGGVGTERGLLSPFQSSPIPLHSNGRQKCSNEVISENTSGISLRRSMIVHPEIVNVAESSFRTVTFRPSFEPCNLSQYKWPPHLPKDEVSGLRFPTFVHPPNCQSISIKDNFQAGMSCSLELQTSSPKKPTISKLASVGHQSLEANQRHDKNSISDIQASDKMFPKISLKMSSTEEGQSEVSELLPNGEQKKNSELNQTATMKDQAHTNLSTQATKISGGDATSEQQNGIVHNSDASALGSQSCHELQNDTKNVHRNESCENENPREEKSSSTFQVNFEYKSEDLSLTLAKDGASCVIISPDVLMEMIGQKYFLQARKSIIHQQRVFSIQVFELHRILKVQRMLMDSGKIQQTEHPPFTKSLAHQTSMMDLIPEPFPNAPLWNSLPINEVGRNKFATDSVIGKPPELLPLTSDPNMVAANSVQSLTKPANNNLPMWCVPPPGNQWLLPVISPSEGLIYKPYPHHHPNPPESVLTTLYSECGPNTPVAIPTEEFLNSSPSGVCGPTPWDSMYIAPYGMPMNNHPFASASSIKHMKALAGFNNFGAGYPSSCVLTGEKVLGGVKDREKLENTRSPKEIKASNDALPLFPITPTSLDVGQPVQTCNTHQQKTQVIKVIPRNPKLASESTARIVKLIQEERKHVCN